MHHYEKLELRMEMFVKYIVDYTIYKQIKDENIDRFVEKMTLEFCYWYSPKKAYDVTKDEVRQMFCDVFNYLNSGKYTFDFGIKNTYVYTTIEPFCETKIIVAPTKKKAIEILSSIPFYHLKLSGHKSSVELVSEYEFEGDSIIAIDKKGKRRVIEENVRDAVINLYRNGVTLNEDDE